MRGKCPCSEFFWFLFSRPWVKYVQIVRRPEKMDRKNCEYGHFLRNAKFRKGIYLQFIYP